MSNRYLVIENGVITNIVLSSPEYAQEQGWIADPQYVNNKTIDIGWLYDGVTFLPPPAVEPTVVASVVPTKEELLKKLEELQNQIMGLSAA